MARPKKEVAEQAETLELSPDVSAQTAETPFINTDAAPASMSKKEAEAIVQKYDGINGVKIPELQKAKEVLKGK